MRTTFSRLAMAIALTAASASAALAEWSPSGPIKFMIGFRAGGGADTQARLIGEGVAEKKGWTFIYENVTGKGGSNLAAALKEQPADGLTIGMAVTETVTYNPLISDKVGFTADDFDYVMVTAPTQMGVVARADKGWTSIDDMVAAAKAGQAIAFSSMSPRLADGAYVLAKNYDLTFNHVSVKGGKGSLNAIMAGDVDAGLVAGIQAKGVASGDLVNLVSAESVRLAMSPDAPTMKELGIPYDFGARFLVLAPKGLDPDARAAITAAIEEVLSDPDAKATQFINKAFGEPPMIQGDALDTLIREEVASNEQLLSEID